MATQTLSFTGESYKLPTTGPCSTKVNQDTTGGPLDVAILDPSNATGFYFIVGPVIGFTSGAFVVDIDWLSTSTSNNAVWEVSCRAYLPGTSTFNVITHAYATAQNATTAARTTSQYPQRTTITLASNDSAAAGYIVEVKVRRLGNDGSDNMGNDAWVFNCNFTWNV